MLNHKRQPVGNPKVVKTKEEVENALKQLEEELNNKTPNVLTSEEAEARIIEIVDSWFEETD